MRTQMMRWLLIGLLIVIGFASLNGLWNITSTSDFGKADFIAYWSATYLLQHNQNPYDEAAMDALQHGPMNTEVKETIMAWNPPSVFVFVLPFVFVPFTTARFLLLLVNLIILFAAGLMLTWLYLPRGKPWLMMVYLLFALTFPQVLSGLFMGQITFFVFFGLVCAMVLIKKEKWFWAGVVLVLTTIKPQLVVLTLIYLLVSMARKRHYTSWLGLALAGLVSAVLLFILRPNLISDVIGLMAIAPIHWATPTIGGLLSYWQLTDYGRYLIVLFLPLPFILLKYESKISMELAVAILTLVTLPTTFFGWSYDQTMLLIPIAQIFSWVSLSKNRMFNFCLVSASLIAVGFIFYQRIVSRNDVYYLWVPLLLSLIFGLVWYKTSQTRPVEI